MESIADRVRVAAPHIVNLRRRLHRIPETGFNEKRTAALMAEELAALGLPVRTGIAGTGVTALLDSGRPGPTVMLRADMDALPITEATGLPYASEHPGCMHACGHDMHMAMLLGTARVLSALVAENPGALRGRILFLFQPAEEGPGGAAPMIEAGVLDDPRVDVCLGAHVWPEIPAGFVGVKPGPLMAAMDRFELTVLGKGGHAANPHLCVDALETATQVVGALQRVVSRMTSPLEPVILTIGELHAGTAYNVIPGEARMAGTVRAFAPEVRNLWEQRINQVAGGVCAAMGATHRLDFQWCHPAVINDPRAAAEVRRAALDAVGADRVMEPLPTMGGEDFSMFLQRVPGCFFFVGCGGPGVAPVHNPCFAPDESCLPVGAEVLCRAAVRLCAGWDAPQTGA